MANFEKHNTLCGPILEQNIKEFSEYGIGRAVQSHRRLAERFMM